MALSGIYVSLIKRHSARLASTSKANLSGASIQEILGESRWPSESIWQKLYRKPLIPNKKNSQDGIQNTF